MHNYETEIIDYFSNEYFDTSQLETLPFGNSSKNTFVALAINLRSIANINNFSRLEAFVASLNFKPDLISLTETWIKSMHSGPYKNLDGYNFISNIGGGVAFYIKDTLEFTLCDVLIIMKGKFSNQFLSIFKQK